MPDPSTWTQLQLSPRSLLAGAGNMDRPRQTRLLIRRSGTARSPKQIQVYGLPAAVPVIQENTGGYGLSGTKQISGQQPVAPRVRRLEYLEQSVLCCRSAATSRTATRYRRLHPFHPASRNLDSFNLTPSCALPLSLALALSLLALLFFSLSGLAEENEKEKKRNC